MIRSILGVIVGCVLGMVLMMVGHALSVFVYPPPKDLDIWDPNNQDAFKEYVRTLPDGAFVLVVLSHAMGPLGGGGIAALIAKRGKVIVALIVGAFFLVGGILNLQDVPHPDWFAIADPVMYLPVAFAVGLLVAWLTAPAPGNPQQTPIQINYDPPKT